MKLYDENGDMKEELRYKYVTIIQHQLLADNQVFIFCFLICSIDKWNTDSVEEFLKEKLKQKQIDLGNLVTILHFIRTKLAIRTVFSTLVKFFFFISDKKLL